MRFTLYFSSAIFFIILAIPLLNTNTMINASIDESSIELDNWVTNEIATELQTHIRINIYDPSQVQDGLNLFVIQNSTDDQSPFTFYLSVIDNMGNFIFEPFAVSAFEQPQLLNDTTLLFLGEKGKLVFWNFQSNTFQNLTVSRRIHHDFHYNNITKTILVIDNYKTEVLNQSGFLESTYIDRVIEYDLEGNKIFVFDAKNYTNFNDFYEIFGRLELGNIIDKLHSNSIDWVNDTIWLNVRNFNQVFQINKTTNDVDYVLGFNGNFTMYDAFGNVKESLWYLSHDFHLIPETDNEFILFDNGRFNLTDRNYQYSSILRIRVDYENMEIHELDRYTLESDYYSRVVSSAQVLENGNYLAGAGFWYKNDSLNIGGVGLEVDSNKNKVWELILDYGWGFYRFNRIKDFRSVELFTPFLSSPIDKFYGSGEDISVNWKTWHIFRTNAQMPGTYRLYINDILQESGDFNFEQDWYPTDLVFNLNIFSDGIYNVTLVVSGEGGHTVSDSILIQVVSFYVDQFGFESIETGQSNTQITWSGYSQNSLQGEIIVNGVQFDTFTWTGSNMTLDLSSWAQGQYNITFLLFINTELVYKSVQIVTVFPTTPPDVILSPLDYILDWNSSFKLSWVVFDHSPANWKILMNNSEIDSGLWTTQSFVLNWSVPFFLNPGKYNLTVVFTDVIDKWTANTIWLTILPPHKAFIELYSDTIYQWVDPIANLSWNVAGGTNWTIWRNSTILTTGQIKNNQIIQPILWQFDSWQLGRYNITLEIDNIDGSKSINQHWLIIEFHISDPYADEIINGRSLWSFNRENCIGAPDGVFARISFDYTNGYMTVDMGENEEIIDKEGDDVQIIGKGGNYNIWLGKDLNSPFKEWGIGTGNQSLDLNDIGINNTRYLRLEYVSGNDILIDAIVARNYWKSFQDNQIPDIHPIDDKTINVNEVTTVELSWEVFDHTPWKYNLYINDQLFSSCPWNGSRILIEIPIEFFDDQLQLNNVRLIVFDLFGNQNSDEVSIELVSTQLSTITSSKSKKATASFFSFLTIFPLILYFKKRRKK